MKWMGIMFLGLCVLAIPQYLMFGFSGKLAGTLSSETSLHMLSQLGMGNMGEGRSLCAEAVESTVLALQCGK
jgi:hypothetical protein